MASNRMKTLRTGVFIDGSNMFWGSKTSGIRIDWEKLKKYLKKQYKPVVLNYYACEDNAPKTPEKVAYSLKQKKFHQKLEGIGYHLIRKDIKHLACNETKCDMDVELVMDLRNYENDLDCIILFTGDSDHLATVQYYWGLGKSIRIFSFKELLSWELKTFAMNNPRCNYKIINEIRDKIERKPIAQLSTLNIDSLAVKV